MMMTYDQLFADASRYQKQTRGQGYEDQRRTKLCPRCDETGGGTTDKGRVLDLEFFGGRPGDD